VVIGVEIAALCELIELVAADEKPPRQQSVSCARWMPTRSRDDEKPVSGCNGVTSGCDAVSVIDELIARYAARTIGVMDS
jgi:hypothetical protein